MEELLTNLIESFCSFEEKIWAELHPDFAKPSPRGKTYQQEWIKQGFTLNQAQKWISQGFQPTQLSAIIKWRGLGFSAQEVRVLMDYYYELANQEAQEYLLDLEVEKEILHQRIQCLEQELRFNQTNELVIPHSY